MIKIKSKIKKGDNVVIIAGKDKGKKGKVLKFIRTAGRLVVEGINEQKKHKKASKSGEKGQVVTIAMLMDVSNVALFCAKCKKATRIGALIEGDKKSRVCVKCKGVI